MTVPGMFFVHTATVQTYKGQTATGPSLASAVQDPCFIEDDQRLVASATGEQVTSGARLYAARASAALYAPGSLVASSVLGRVSKVINLHVRDSGGLGLPDHVEVDLS